MHCRKTEACKSVSVRKSKQDQPLGIAFKKGADGSIFISKIKEDGLFAGSDLQPGMRVKSINGVATDTTMELSTITTLLSSAPDEVEIVVDTSKDDCCVDLKLA